MNAESPTSRRRAWLLLVFALLLAAMALFRCARKGAAPSAAAAPGVQLTAPGGSIVGGFVRALAYSPDGKAVVTAAIHGTRTGQVGEIKLWNASNGQAQATIPGYATFVYSLAFSPDGNTLAFGQAKKGDFGSVTLWDLSAGKARLAFPVHHESVTALVFSPDGKFLATGALDGVVRLSGSADGSQLALLLGHRTLVSSISYSADGKLLATGSWDRTVRLWRKARSAGVIRLPWAVWCVALSPDGMTLAAAGNDPTVRVFDTLTGRAWGPPLTGHQGPVNAVAYSPDGLLMATGSEDRTVKLWSVPTHQCIGTYAGHTGSVNALAFSPDSRRLASSGNDSTLRIWIVGPVKPPARP